MEKGEIRMIFEDPLTCEKEEGKAKLIAGPAKMSTSQMEYWLVRFLSDGYQVRRWIKI